jgi:glycosyltransferase involved in cell wall biosynthesis
VPAERSRVRCRRIVIVRAALVATYTPARCGIATFTADLAEATGTNVIAAIESGEGPLPYPAEVRHQIRRDVPADYLATASALSRDVDLVSVQHEYGIWGGEDGDHVLEFVRALDVPAVATLHTVLRDPSPHQRAVLAQLTSLAAGCVVMSDGALDLLVDGYGADPAKLHVIPHGVPDLPLVDSATVKPALGLTGRDVILSFGLLGPGKGYELAIDAMPDVVAEHPDVIYVILGATHPDLIRREGEAYRSSLVARVAKLGLEEHVRFVDRFVSLPELGRWLEAADVAVTPYPNLGQIVSGTLSYAMGAGRPVVSTPYAYAEEFLAEGRGMLVRPGSPAAFAAAVRTLLADPGLRARMGAKAFAHSRGMIWSAVGRRYRDLFAGIAGGHRTTQVNRASRAVSDASGVLVGV